MQDEKPTSSGGQGWSWKKANSNQKIAFIIFVVSAVFLLFLSGASVFDGIQAPFRGSVQDLIKNKDLLKDPIVEQEKLERRTDTDGDGISDWLETNTFKTSPYLWSTAGDDVPDNVKLALGENPLCKHGEKCTPNPMRFDLGSSTLPYADLLDSQKSVKEISTYLTGNSKMAETLKQEAGQAGASMDLRSQVPTDPAIIRKALLDTGKVTKEQLEGVTDGQLMQMVNQAIEDTEKEQQKPVGLDSLDASGNLNKVAGQDGELQD